MRKFQSSQIPTPRVTLPEDFWNRATKLPGNFVALDIEVGCGVGLHAVNYALQHLDRTLIAIDRSAMRMGKMLDRIAEYGGVSNLVPIRENAIWFLTHQIPENTVENYFFLYPNPYPKKKQANMRWHNMPFMEHVIATLKEKGKMIVATNMQYYADEAKEMMVKTWGMKLIEEQTYSSIQEIPLEPRTHFEKKYLERGETCWNLVFQK